MAEAETKAAVAKAPETKKTERPKGPPTHIRFIGHPSDDENSSTSVFGKVFYRGKWVPIENLNGGNPEKRAMHPDQLRKLIGDDEGHTGNPAFQLGHGEDTPIPGVAIRTDDPELEEA